MIVLTLIALTIIGASILSSCKDVQTDSRYEEIGERVVENILESELGLENDELENVIDFSFWDNDDGEEG